MNIAKIAVSLKKGNRSYFYYPVQVQYDYMDSLGEPRGFLDRSYKQFLCQELYVPLWKKIFWFCISLLIIPCVVIVFFVKGCFIHFTKKIESVAQEWGRNNVFPEDLTKKYHINWEAWHSGFALSLKDIIFIYHNVLRWYQPYFIFKVIMRIASYSPIITKYKPDNLIVNLEFSFCSSILTYYCHSRNVKHINVMHGEKLRFIRDSFFHFDECYVWDDHYIQLFIRQKAEPNQFHIALPPDMLINIADFQNKKVYADYKYYLAIYNEQEIESIVASMSFVKERGLTVKYRPHPRYSNIALLRKYVNPNDIEDPFEIDIKESVSNMRFAVGSYTTVLLQAHFAGKRVLLDDITYKDRYEQLQDFGYILSDKLDGVERLSNKPS